MARKQRYIMMVVPSLPEQGGGGVVQVIGYLRDAWRQRDDVPPMRLLVTRGHGSIWLSPFYLLRALAVLAVECGRGRVALVHVNLSVRGSTWRKLTVVAVADLFGVPVVLHLHSGQYPRFYAELGDWRRRLVQRLFSGAWIVVVLGEMWRRFVHDEIGVPAASIAVIRNAVPDPKCAGFMPASADDHPDVRIIFLGQLGPNKGTPELLQALASPRLRARQWSATLIGDGDVSGTRDFIHESKLSDRISVPGWLSNSDVTRQLAASDIFVLPSHAEGLSIALLEVMALGLAIVTTPVGAHDEVIVDKKNGLLVSPGDVEALTDALCHLLRDEKLRRRLGAEARRSFEERFAVSTLANRFREIYSGVPNA